MKTAMKIMMFGLAMGCETKEVASVVTGGDGNDALADCDVPPEIDHDNIDGSQTGGVDVLVTAFVYDDEVCDLGILGVDLFYAQSTAIDWTRISMTPGTEPEEWRAAIPGSAVGSAEMRYFIRAEDKAGNIEIDPPDADVDFLKAYSFGVSTR
jgi:hypothetical protein